MLIEAAKPLNYGRRLYRIGDRFEATKQHAWLLVAVGKCAYVNAPEPMMGFHDVSSNAAELETETTDAGGEPPKRKRGRPKKIKEAVN